VFGASNPRSLKHLVQAANRQLAQETEGIVDAWIFDYENSVAECGLVSWEDSRLYHMARVPSSFEGLRLIASRFCRSLASVRKPTAKCIVVDLDNTIWGGVIGDDGMGAIQVGHDYPGNVFREIQVFLKGLRARGIVLAVASKNTESVALEALEHHPEMVLRASDFSVLRINWQPKSQSVHEIAHALNIGLDSIVFLDDNPVERAEVRLHVPQVVVPELSSDITQWMSVLLNLEALDNANVTIEDTRRADMYAAEASRQRLQQDAASVEDFLGSLEMSAEVGLLSERELERVHQLIQKTNQFNLTTRRYSKAQLAEIVADSANAVAWLRLADKYGDLGLVCVGILRQLSSDLWEIDSFLMSCRVMGRGVEAAFLTYLFELAIERGAPAIRGVFLPTAKNGPVRTFYENSGFMIAHGETQDLSDAKIYHHSLQECQLAWPSFIRRIG
jgi:FkbH-like protein